jgi:RNA polymerase sigma-70 factor, ECF subfamily
MVQIPSESTDLDLAELNAARSGDADALGRLLVRYEAYLKLLAAPELNRRLRSRVDTSDLVQETFFEAHRDFDNFRGETRAELFGWLRQILANNVAQTIRQNLCTAKRNVRREVSQAQLAASINRSSVRLETIVADQGRSPDSLADIEDNKALLARQMEQLPEDYREVLVLRHLESLSFKDVAQRMDRSEGAVRMLWLRALDKLRSRMARFNPSLSAVPFTGGGK